MNRIHSIFPFLKFFMGFFMLNFAAGDGGFMSAFESGASAPPVDLGADDGGEDDADAVTEPNTEGTPEGEKPDADGKPAATASDGLPDLAKPLSKDAKKSLSELKQTNPAAWKELNAKLWSLDGIDKKIGEKFDGGLEEAIQLKTDVDTFLQEARAENLGEIKEELHGFRGIDAKLMNGDTTFLNDLPPQMQEGLFKMMPTFAAEWQDRDNESYQKYFGGLVVATLRDTAFVQNLDMALWKLDELGAEDPALKKIHDLLSANRQWIKELDTKSKAPAAAKAPTADDPVTAREKTVQQKELRISQGNVVTKFRQAFDSKTLAELKKVASGPDGKIPAHVNKAEVVARAMNNLAKAWGPGVESRVDQYLKAKDEEGAFKYLSTQVGDKRLNQAVTQAYRYLYGNGISAKPNNPPPGDKGGKPNAGGDNAPTGFVTINYDPKPSSIDVTATTKLAQSQRMTYRQMVSQNKAVLKNGKRVTWPRDAKGEE